MSSMAQVRDELRAGAITALDNVAPSFGVQARVHFGGSREPELAVLSRFIGPGDEVIDAGAHRGLYSWHMARLTGPGGVVWAFEPQPNLAMFLRRAFRRQPNVRIDHRALSDNEGHTEMTVPNWGGKEVAGHASIEKGEGEGRRVFIATTTLDSFQLKPTFIKADVEGHEIYLLRGAEQTMRTHRPAVLLEVDRRRPDPDDHRRAIVDFLTSLDYGAHYVVPEASLREFEMARLIPSDDPISEHGYVYNFIFLPR